MQAKTCASTVKIYLFFLFISLFAISGCGLDIDFGGGGSENGDVEENEVIMGFIEEIIPDIGEDSDVVVKASVVKDETVTCCEDTTSERDDFYIEGNLDPKAELEFFEGGDSLGTIRLPVFPGAMLHIRDITIEDKVPRYTDIDIIFEGQVDSKNCVNDTSSRGTIRVKISSEGSETEVTVNLISRTAIERGDEEDLPCEEIVEGRKVRVDGKLRIGETVDAGLIEIL